MPTIRLPPPTLPDTAHLHVQLVFALMPRVPDKPTLDGIEARWAERWEVDGVYRFDRAALDGRDRTDVFVVDTPPPTVSGSIHMGNIFGYTHTDCIVRYQRMSGKVVYYPIGWDDNGLATERRVQNYFGVRCDPSQHYDPDFQPPFRGDTPSGHQEVPISRPNFIELCHELTATDEAVFEDTFRRLGLSFDWSLLYTTINDVSRRTSQLAFLRNLGARRGVQRRRTHGLGRRRPHGRRPGRDRGP